MEEKNMKIGKEFIITCILIVIFSIWFQYLIRENIQLKKDLQAARTQIVIIYAEKKELETGTVDLELRRYKKELGR